MHIAIDPNQVPTSSFALDGQVALITGSSRGIGRAIAEAMARQGAAVVVTGRTAADVECIAAAGGDALALRINIPLPWLLSRRVAEQLIAQGSGGAIVNVSSMVGGRSA